MTDYTDRDRTKARKILPPQEQNLVSRRRNKVIVGLLVNQGLRVEEIKALKKTEESAQVVANCDHLKNLKYSPQLPHVFTEHGAVMLASVLNSDRAIEVNIQIIRIFTKMRELMLTHKDILLKLEQLERLTCISRPPLY